MDASHLPSLTAALEGGAETRLQLVARPIRVLPLDSDPEVDASSRLGRLYRLHADDARTLDSALAQPGDQLLLSRVPATTPEEPT